MAKDNKFGTFGGVFTPSILTILGVIMYLRLPWVVGNAGLYAALGIIAVAHVISVCTGLSVSSIATDKSVGAGGPYYIISRSLGLPIGGALGLSLFLGLSFSISLYVIGFCESFLAYFDLPTGPEAIRVAGTITVIVLTLITLISTAFAIKTQYVIMAAIALSLVSIFLADPSQAPREPAMAPAPESPTLGEIFGIFFPAVTGFTAGVNMSGDLRDPKRAIPVGTMAAISVGAIVYFVLAAFTAYRIPREQLLTNTTVFVDVARVPELVVAGIWGATLSSALGSIMGAPRILQALSVDKVTPKFFAKGYGPTNEPRNALIVAFAIGEAGILIAELDAIARIVSMVFLTTYAVLNLSAFIESWASPDFRPEFKIPKTVSLIGFLTAGVVMIQLDLAAMLGAMAVMAGLFFYLQRKQLRLESGDTWEGLWATIVRAGLFRLTRERRQQRNWRPNLLVFTDVDDPHRNALLELTRTLVSGSGVATHFDLDGKADAGDVRRAETDPNLVGMFHRRIPPADGGLVPTMLEVCRYHGIAGMEPNSVLVDWYALRDDPERLHRLLDELAALDENALLYAPAPVGLGNRERIDVWWEPTSGHLALCLSLVRFVASERSWAGARIRVLLVASDTADVEPLRVAAGEILSDLRVDGIVRVIDNSLRARGYLDWVREESADADLTITGLPADDPDVLRRLIPLVEELGTVLIVRAAPSFRELLRASTIARRPETPSDAASSSVDLALSDRVAAPGHPRLAHLFEARRAHVEDVGQRLFADCIGRIEEREGERIDRLEASFERNFAVLERGVKTANLRRLRSLVNRVHSAFLHDMRELDAAILDSEIEDARTRLAAVVDEFVDAERWTFDAEGVVRIRRPAADFAAADGDDGELRRIKRRKRIVARLRGGTAGLKVPVARYDRYLHAAMAADVAAGILRAFVTGHLQLALDVGKLMNASRTSLGLLLEGAGSPEEAAEFSARQKKVALERIGTLRSLLVEEQNRLRQMFVDGSSEVLGGYAALLERIDVGRAVEEVEKATKVREGVRAELQRVPVTYAEGQHAVFRRARLGIDLSHFHHRMAVAALRMREAMQMRVRSGPMHDCRRLGEVLDKFAEALEGTSEPAAVKLPSIEHGPIDPKWFVEELHRELEDLVRDLPEVFETVPDAVLQALAEGESASFETVEIAVRRLVEYVCQTDLLAVLEAELRAVAQREQDAVHVAQDVARLVAFHVATLAEATDEDRPEARSQLASVIERGAERIEQAVTSILEAVDHVDRTVLERVRQVIEHTSPYELTRAGRALELAMRSHRRRGAVGRMRDRVEALWAEVRDRGVATLYRRSAEARAALDRALEGDSSAGVVQQVLAATDPWRPAPGVLEALPFHYRQLFLSGSPPGESFWVARPELEERCQRAVDRFTRGRAGMLLVTGDPGTGKTALLSRLADARYRHGEVYRVQAPLSGAGTVAVFESAIRSATGRQGPMDAVLESLPAGSTIALDDLEAWWTRGPDGWAVLETVARLVDRHGDHLFIAASINRRTLDTVDRVVALRDRALEIVECTPLGVEAIERAILLRHWSSGCRFRLEGREEGQLSSLARVRLFSAIFGRSRGNVGAALHAWVAAITDVDGQMLSVRAPTSDRLGALDDLPPSWEAALAELVLHKRLDTGKIGRIRGFAESGTDVLAVLVRAGLVAGRRDRGFGLDPFVRHELVRHLVERGVLP